MAKSGEQGMITFDQALVRAYEDWKENEISYEEARSASSTPTRPTRCG
jgi:Tfp pilus assembly ATPase PilU